MTQHELARQVGCAPKTIYKLEAGERRPSKEIAQRILTLLHVPPDEQPPLLALARQQRRHDQRPAPGAPDAAPAPAPPLLALPRQATSFVGREREVAELQQLLAGKSARLVTLIGPGGVGKTRLAIHVATLLQEVWRDGTFFISLAALSEPGLAISAINHGLGVKESGGQPALELLKAYLRQRQLLLLLDNLEQVLAVAPALAEVLAAAPQVTLLATSRTPLAVAGEHSFAVPPLPLPNLGQRPPYQALMTNDAVRLFIARAQAITPQLTVDETIARMIAEICARLDGLPLAIELAAARSRLFTPEVMLRHLDKRLALLARGPSGLPERQQTLRATVEWSYQLLDPQEQLVFRRLCVCVGGCGVEAASALAGAEPWPAPMDLATIQKAGRPAELAVLEQVESLLHQSMLSLETDHTGQSRIVFLETIREYGLEQLADVGEARERHDRHARYYLALAEHAEPQLTGPGQQRWLDQLEREHENMRAALEWSLAHAPNRALRLAGALWRFWYLRGYFEEGRRWLSASLGQAAEAPAAARALALAGAGWLADSQGDYQQAAALYAQALALHEAHDNQHGMATVLYHQARTARSLGSYDDAHELYVRSVMLARRHQDRWLVAAALNGLGWVQAQRGRYAEARELLEESLRLTQEVGDAERLAAVILTLGSVLLHQGEYDRARGYLQESGQLSRAIGDKLGLATSLSNLGLALLQQGLYDQARGALEECRTLARELSYKIGLATSLTNLGDLAVAEGDYRRAGELYHECLTLAYELGSTHLLASSIADLAALAAVQRRLEQAAILFGAAEQLYAAIGIQPDAAHGPRQVALLQDARTLLGEAPFAQLASHGAALSLDELVAYAAQHL